MSLKTTKIIYRVCTIVLALFILPGLFFMDSEMAKEGLAAVQLTDAVWLQQLLGYASPFAIIIILLGSIANIIPHRLKEWAYVGLGIVYIGAFWAHFQLGHSIDKVIMPIVVFAILL